MKRAMIIVSFNVLILSALLLIMEGFLRWYVSYDPGYYTGVKSNNSCIEYPYGTICLNSYGYPDGEFSRSGEKYRIGYIGDSVCYGVGAGQEARITEQLKREYPLYEHMNFCYAGENVLSKKTLETVLEIVDEYSVNHVVYLMNLNDIGPLLTEIDSSVKNGSNIQHHKQRDNKYQYTPLLVRIKKYLIPLDEELRGRSYVYTWIRSKAKEYLTVAGYEASGYRAIELFPKQYNGVFKYAAGKIVWLKNVLLSRGVKFTLIILPYEMQISGHAAEVYRDLRIKWEEGFVEGGAQEQLLNSFEEPVDYIDARHAFDSVRDTARVGEYFVYNKGDKIDWNHPNRAGHRRIAVYVAQQSPF